MGVGLFQEQEEKGRQLGVWEVPCIREGWQGMAGRNEVGKPTAWRKRKQDVTSCLPQSPHLGWLVPKTEHLHVQAIAESSTYPKKNFRKDGELTFLGHQLYTRHFASIS